MHIVVAIATGLHCREHKNRSRIYMINIGVFCTSCLVARNNVCKNLIRVNVNARPPFLAFSCLITCHRAIFVSRISYLLSALLNAMITREIMPKFVRITRNCKLDDLHARFALIDRECPNYRLQLLGQELHNYYPKIRTTRDDCLRNQSEETIVLRWRTRPVCSELESVPSSGNKRKSGWRDELLEM